MKQVVYTFGDKKDTPIIFLQSKAILCLAA